MKENFLGIVNFILHNIVKILAIIFVIMGIITISVNSGLLMGFKYAYSLSDVNLKNIKSGMCVSDMLDYTYGHVSSEYGLTGSKEVYVVGIGGKKNQFILMKKNVSNTFSAFKTEFDDLMVINMRTNDKPKSSNAVRIYGIIKRTKRSMFPYEYFENILGLSRLKLNTKVSTKYHLQLVKKEDIEHKVVTGIWELIIGGICTVFVIYRRKKKMQYEIELDKKLLEKRLERNLLDDYIVNMSKEKKVAEILLSGDEGQLEITTALTIEKVIANIREWKVLNNKEMSTIQESEYINNKFKVMTILFDDCTDIQIQFVKYKTVQYLSQYYELSDEFYSLLASDSV